jgi:hypothetical protein
VRFSSPWPVVRGWPNVQIESVRNRHRGSAGVHRHCRRSLSNSWSYLFLAGPGERIHGQFRRVCILSHRFLLVVWVTGVFDLCTCLRSTAVGCTCTPTCLLFPLSLMASLSLSWHLSLSLSLSLPLSLTNYLSLSLYSPPPSSQFLERECR